MATHSSVLAWRIPGTGSWCAIVYGIAQSRTQLKRLSSSSSKLQIACEEVEREGKVKEGRERREAGGGKRRRMKRNKSKCLSYGPNGFLNKTVVVNHTVIKDHCGNLLITSGSSACYFVIHWLV